MKPWTPTPWRRSTTDVETCHAVDISLEARAASINAHLDEAQNLGERCVFLRLLAGKELIEARALVEPGQWIAWCAANIKRSRSDIAAVMKLAADPEPEKALELERAKRAEGMRRVRADKHVRHVADIATTETVNSADPVAYAPATVEAAGDLPTLRAGDELTIFETEAKTFSEASCVIRESAKHPGYFDVIGLAIADSGVFETRPDKPIIWRALQDMIAPMSEHKLTPDRWRWQIEPRGTFERVREYVREALDAPAEEAPAVAEAVAEPPAEPKSVSLLRQALLAFADEVAAGDPNFDEDDDGARFRESASSPHIDHYTFCRIAGEIERVTNNMVAAAKRDARERAREARLAAPADHRGPWRTEAA